MSSKNNKLYLKSEDYKLWVYFPDWKCLRKILNYI